MALRASVRVIALGVALVLAPAKGADAASDCTIDGRYVMGTILQVELCASDPQRRRDAADMAFATVRRLDALLTTYSPDSPTSRFNDHAGQGAQQLPPEVVELLAFSREYEVLTEGTFDVTVGPLVALWREAGAAGRLPSPAALAAARERVAGARLALDADGRSATLPDAGMAVDFGGIGKGYALDRVTARLAALGIDSALIDFGRSSVQAVGHPSDAAGWRLLLQNPAGVDLGVVTLRDRAMSVSGSLGQSSEIAGHRYGHVVDPRSGLPLERDLLATVVAPNGAGAEALSKALLILGEGEGIALLERLDGVEGMLADADGRTWSTRGWRAAVAFEAAPPGT